MRTFERVLLWIQSAAPHPLFWLGGPLLLYSWTIPGPFLWDDIQLLVKAERIARNESVDWQLFRFAKSDEEWYEMRNRGAAPWWAPDGGRLDFFRPIPALSFHLDTRVLGRSPIGHRLVSLAVFAAVLLALHWMFAQAGFDSVRAGAATFFFGIAQSVTLPVIWICNRADLFVVFGVAIAAGAYWRARSSQRLSLIAVGAAGYGLALMSKEAALPFFLIPLLCELLPWFRREYRQSSRTALTLVIVFAAMTAVYLLYYYLSRPWLASIEAADGVPGPTEWIARFPLYLAVWMVGFPIDALLALEEPQRTWAVFLVAAAGGSLAVVTVCFLRRSWRDDPAVFFFACWAILFIVPALRSQFASARLLCTATAGWSYLLTVLILPKRQDKVPVPRFLRHGYLLANSTMSVACAAGLVLYLNSSERKGRALITHIAATASPPIRDGDTIIVLRGNTLAESTYAGDRLEYLTGIRAGTFAFLLAPGIDATVEVEDDHTLLVRAKDRSLFDSAHHALTLPRGWKPRVGQAFDLRGLSVTIAETRADDFVSALRLRFRKPLSSDRIHFYPSQFAEAARPAPR